MSVVLPAGVTIERAPDLMGLLTGAVEGGRLHVDASALTEFDTAALALLLQARRLAQAEGASFEVSGAPPKLVELARLYGVDAMLALG